jgi:hypothetical protein
MKDQAIEEIRQRRRDLCKQKYGGTVEQMVAAAMQIDSSHPAKVVRAHDRQGRHRIPA